MDEHGTEYSYREYRKEPLSVAELKALFAKLKLGPKDVLRPRDKAAGEAGIQGGEPDEVLIAAMAEHPTLLQRPIGVRGNRAAVGRPPEALLALLE